MVRTAVPCLNGMKFVRQSPIGPFFVDFACREAKIIVEVDGGTHSTDEEIARDRARSAYLESEGFRNFRAHNIDVYENMDGVLETLLAFVRAEVS